MPVYVIDAYGLSAVGDLVAPQQLNPVLHVLTDRVKDGTLRFPDSVWRECCKYMDEHNMGLWAKGAAGHLPKDMSTWEHEGEVLDAAPDLVDPEAVEYQTQVDVAKVAVWLNETGENVVVVTQDVTARPDRMSLAAACVELDIEWVDTAAYLDAVIPFSYS